MTTMRIEIQKTNRGWSCITYAKHPDFKHEAITNVGYRTLKIALWDLMLRCVECDYTLLYVKVKGKDLPFKKVWDIVYKALVGSPLAYHLPKIQKLLEV